MNVQFLRIGEHCINLSNVAYITKRKEENIYFLVQFVGVTGPLRVEGTSEAGRVLERQVFNPVPLSDE